MRRYHLLKLLIGLTLVMGLLSACGPGQDMPTPQSTDTPIPTHESPPLTKPTDTPARHRSRRLRLPQNLRRRSSSTQQRA
jgi:uncharacterized lipoprotein